VSCIRGGNAEGKGPFIHNYYCYGLHSNPTVTIVKNDNSCDPVASCYNHQSATINQPTVVDLISLESSITLT
jgi:hypothetical protein